MGFTSASHVSTLTYILSTDRPPHSEPQHLRCSFTETLELGYNGGLNEFGLPTIYIHKWNCFRNR